METVNALAFRSLTIALFSCALANGQMKPPAPFPTPAELATVSVEYQNGPISLHISANGLVEYNGSGAVIVEGKHQLRIKPAEVQQLVESFRRAKFFALADQYSSGTVNSGTTTIAMQAGAMKKTIVADWTQAPAALEELHEDLLKYSHSDQWVVGNSDTVKSLLAETPNPARRNDTLSDVLPRAAAYGDTTLVAEILTHKVDTERRAVLDATPLMHAAERGMAEMVNDLLKAGAKVAARDQEGRSALIFAARSGNAVAVELLLDAGAKGNEADKYGDTALMAAAAAGEPNCVDLLIKRGAEVNAQNSRHQTALLSGAMADDGFVGKFKGQRASAGRGRPHPPRRSGEVDPGCRRGCKCSRRKRTVGAVLLGRRDRGGDSTARSRVGSSRRQWRHAVGGHGVGEHRGAISGCGRGRERGRQAGQDRVDSGRRNELYREVGDSGESSGGSVRS